MGMSAHHGSAPYGIDRLYYDTTETPTLRLRYLPGARRQLINEQTEKCIEGFEARRTNQSRLILWPEVRKVRLVPGDPKMVEAIQEAFRLRYRHGWGYTRIGQYFVSKGVYPLRAMYWHDSGVRDILMNPIYLGWGYFLQMKTGLHYNADANGPQERLTSTKIHSEAVAHRLTVPRDRRCVARCF